jgi:hypothetical protein
VRRENCGKKLPDEWKNFRINLPSAFSLIQFLLSLIADSTPERGAISEIEKCLKTFSSETFFSSSMCFCLCQRESFANFLVNLQEKLFSFSLRVDDKKIFAMEKDSSSLAGGRERTNCSNSCKKNSTSLLSINGIHTSWQREEKKTAK